jgi:hypothetical protein
MNEFQYSLDETGKYPILKNGEMDLEYVVTGYSTNFIRTETIDLYGEQISNIEFLMTSLHNDFPELLI